MNNRFSIGTEYISSYFAAVISGHINLHVRRQATDEPSAKHNCPNLQEMLVRYVFVS